VARPLKRHRDEEEDDAADKVSPIQDKKTSKKRKSDEGVIDGYELPPDRQVKRGWTESSSAKKESGRPRRQTRN